MPATPISFDPANFTSLVEAPYTLGAWYSDPSGRVFRYLRNKNTAGDNALVPGDVCCWAATLVSGTIVDPYKVSDGLTTVGSSLAGNPVACVSIANVPKDYYFMGLVKGLSTIVKSTGSTAGNEQMISATAGTCTNHTGSAAIKSLGLCLLATAGGVCTVEVDI